MRAAIGPRVLAWPARAVARNICKLTETRPTAQIDKGLYPKAFCKIIPDLLAGDPGGCQRLRPACCEKGAAGSSCQRFVSTACPLAVVAHPHSRCCRILQHHACGRRGHQVIISVHVLEGDRRRLCVAGNCAGQRLYIYGMNMHLHTYIHTYIHAYIHMYMYMYMYICIYCIYICIYIYMHSIYILMFII